MTEIAVLNRGRALRVAAGSSPAGRERLGGGPRGGDGPRRTPERRPRLQKGSAAPRFAEARVIGDGVPLMAKRTEGGGGARRDCWVGKSVDVATGLRRNGQRG